MYAEGNGITGLEAAVTFKVLSGEMEGNVNLSVVEWEGICRHGQQQVPPLGESLSWKTLVSFFCTPAQKRTYSTMKNRWRLCGYN